MLSPSVVLLAACRLPDPTAWNDESRARIAVDRPEISFPTDDVGDDGPVVQRLTVKNVGADPLTATETTRSRSLAATNPNGNNVGLDTETLDGIDTNLRFQLTTTAINDKFRLLRTAIGG